MKNQSFYLCFLVLLFLFIAQTYTYAQEDCTILDPPSGCTDIVPITLAVNDDGVITVDDAFIAEFLSDANANTHVQLIIPAGEYKAASFENLNFCRTTIKVVDMGETTFSGYSLADGDPRGNTINILNCHNLEFDGHDIKVLDAYGSGVLYGPNDQAVFVGKASSCINIHHLDIQNPSGFAGIMAKDSPGCEKGLPIDIADANAPFCITYTFITTTFIIYDKEKVYMPGILLS